MIGIIIAAAVVALIAVVIIRTLMFVPKAAEERPYEKVEFDGDAAVKALGDLVRCRTISYSDSSLEDKGEFEKLIGMLPELYPNVYKTCEFKQFPDRGILYYWKGKKAGDAAVFMAHYDVVPVEPENWKEDPFSALIKDGVMWGRGTIDTKVTFNGVLSAAENLIKQGFQPEYDVYFAFSGQEEINGPGATHMVHYFRDNNIKLSMVLDEGGAVVNDVFPGVKENCGMVGIAEKGLMGVELKIEGNGGHASAPAPKSPIGKLSDACRAIESHPCKFHLSKATEGMFDTLGRKSTFVYRMIFANMWLFSGVLDMICKKSGGQLNALVRTTTAFTQMRGSKANNVIPAVATMGVNVRINPADSSDGVVEYMKKTINNPEIQVNKLYFDEPSTVAPTDCPGYARIKHAVEDTWRGTVVAPYLMVQCSDSRHYNEITDKVYKFSASKLTKEEIASIHGNNEKIRVEAIKEAVEFFIRVMKAC